MESIKCIKPGMLTTIQDLGRHEYQGYGVPSSGAMDPLSLRLANIIVGNPIHYAALEVTLIGPELIFKGEGIIAITGADLSPKRNGKSISMWRAIHIHDGDILTFGKGINGCRSYIAILGGLRVSEVLGSKSTYLRGQYGGMEGRPLKSGDVIPVIPASPELIKKVKNRIIPDYNIPNIINNKIIRFIWGPHDSKFTEESIEKFVKSSYMISNHSDRMGYRLQGETLLHRDSADILSEFVAPGTIQVPASGQPILLMTDCQTSGGYTKIGMVIGVDLPIAGQKKPGDSIMFRPITIKEAQEEWKKQEKWLYMLSKNNSHSVGGLT
jgi:antagonist of KipI